MEKCSIWNKYVLFGFKSRIELIKEWVSKFGDILIEFFKFKE